jgi:hypothetical protein
MRDNRKGNRTERADQGEKRKLHEPNTPKHPNTQKSDFSPEPEKPPWDPLVRPKIFQKTEIEGQWRDPDCENCPYSEDCDNYVAHPEHCPVALTTDHYHEIWE